MFPGILGDIMTPKRLDLPSIGQEQCLSVDPTIDDNIVRKVDEGRRPRSIQEIPVY